MLSKVFGICAVSSCLNILFKYIRQLIHMSDNQ